MPTKQAAAAVGQCELMYTYDRIFSKYHHTVAQLLITGDDVEDDTRHTNFTNTLNRLLELGAEVVVFGTGNKLRFPHPRLTAPLTEKRIGVEAMDLQAAGRTYNILMLEGRKAAAALLIERA